MPTRWRVERLLLKYNVFGLERTSKFILRVLNQIRRRDNIAKFFFSLLNQFKLHNFVFPRHANNKILCTCRVVIIQFFFFYKIFDAHKTQMAHCKIERRTRFKVLVKYDDTSSYQMNFFFSAYHNQMRNKDSKCRVHKNSPER